MAAKAAGGAEENLVLLLSLVPYVMDLGEVSVADAATQFRRSEEDITRAVELIACAGIPGDSGAYLHADLFDIDWDLFESEKIIRFEHTIVIDQQPQLSSRETSALIAGLQYLAAHPVYGQRSDVVSLMSKLAGTTNSTPSPQIHVKAHALESLSASIAQAIEARRQLHFHYVNKSGEAERRVVDPISLEAVDDVWYLRAWCHTRQAARVFRLERMSEIEVSSEPAAEHPDVGAPESWSIFDPSDSDLSVTVEFDEPAIAIIAGYLDRRHPPVAEGSRYRAVIPFAHRASLVRFVASHAGLVTVTEPEWAVSAVGQFATDALERHRH